jgi:hypothetical protein
MPFGTVAAAIADDDLDRGSEVVARDGEVPAAMEAAERRPLIVVPPVLPRGVMAGTVPAVHPRGAMAAAVLQMLAAVMSETGRDRPVVIPRVQLGAAVGERMVLPPAALARRRRAGHAHDEGEDYRQENRHTHGASFALIS